MQSRKTDDQTYSQVYLSSKNYNSTEIYAKRRTSLMKKLGSFCVFAGMPVEPGGEEAFVQTWTRFVQDPAFLYLSFSDRMYSDVCITFAGNFTPMAG